MPDDASYLGAGWEVMEMCSGIGHDTSKEAWNPQKSMSLLWNVMKGK